MSTYEYDVVSFVSYDVFKDSIALGIINGPGCYGFNRLSWLIYKSEFLESHLIEVYDFVFKNENDAKQMLLKMLLQNKCY